MCNKLYLFNLIIPVYIVLNCIVLSFPVDILLTIQLNKYFPETNALYNLFNIKAMSACLCTIF